MILPTDDKDLYMNGEEKFGKVGSSFYGITKAIPTLRRFYRFVMADITNFSFRSILDIGSGTGSMLILIGKSRDDFSGMGIDPSPHMVARARKSASKNNLEHRVLFKVGSSREIPDDSKFDIIYTSLSFHHWKDRENSIPKIMDRLNKNGSFLIYEITDDGSFNRKFVKSHLMSKKKFDEISDKICIVPEIKEENGYIRARFKK